MKQPVRIAVTGAAGNISYSLLFKIAAGEIAGAGSACYSATGRNPTGHEQAAWRSHGT